MFYFVFVDEGNDSMDIVSNLMIDVPFPSTPQNITIEVLNHIGEQIILSPTEMNITDLTGMYVVMI
jgi:hypothetical protein